MLDSYVTRDNIGKNSSTHVTTTIFISRADAHVKTYLLRWNGVAGQAQVAGVCISRKEGYWCCCSSFCSCACGPGEGRQINTCMVQYIALTWIEDTTHLCISSAVGHQLLLLVSQAKPRGARTTFYTMCMGQVSISRLGLESLTLLLNQTRWPAILPPTS